MSSGNFAQFLQEVHPYYWATDDKVSQTRLAVKLGTHLGYEFTAVEVEQYMHNQETGNRKLRHSNTQLVFN